MTKIVQHESAQIVNILERYFHFRYVFPASIKVFTWVTVFKKSLFTFLRPYYSETFILIICTILAFFVTGIGKNTKGNQNYTFFLFHQVMIM